MPIIYHLTHFKDWEAAKSSDEFNAESLESEGFIHCSEDETQLLGVAERLFAGQQNLIAMMIDTDLLNSPLKREPSTAGDIYPHIYGPINANAVIGIRRLSTDPEGKFVLDGES